MTGVRSGWLLFGRDLRETWRSRQFRISTLLLALVAAVGLSLAPLLGHVAGQAPAVRVQGPSPVLDQVAAGLLRRGARVAVVRGRAPLVLTVLPGADGAAGTRFVLRGPTADTAEMEVIAGVLNGWSQALRLTALGLPPQAVQRVLTASVVRLQPERPPAAQPLRMAAEAADVALFMAVILYGQMVLMGVSAEKASRVSEVLLVRVPARQLLAAKLAANGLAGLAQLLAVGLAAGAVWAASPGLRALLRPSGLTGMPWWLPALTLLLFVLAYLVYGAVFAAIGASVARPEEVRNAASYPVLVLVAGYYLAFWALAQPARPVLHLLGLLPVFFPFLVLPQAAAGAVPWWEWAGGIGFSLAAAVLLLRWAETIYRRNLLNPAPFSWARLLGRGVR
ncbi:conserved membrane protein of unknown function [Candidatus Hydrogenisulfobacillus filiaventi]|uniref:ABC-2 type transporter transmembrane domain-containing protein n=1 Tax=Candidatus Hydrogenisulfobacillus filiaventi TaxID=2707344 RepID=A0A6F8ZFD6_9FIRM|nr:conserved membrane protein of unknown function [Candidatus Hydrogenisulfobacillus filiaventi]